LSADGRTCGKQLLDEQKKQKATERHEAKSDLTIIMKAEKIRRRTWGGPLQEGICRLDDDRVCDISSVSLEENLAFTLLGPKNKMEGTTHGAGKGGVGGISLVDL